MAGEAGGLPGGVSTSRDSPAAAVVAVLMVSLAAVAAGGVFGLQLQAQIEGALRHKDDATQVETPKIEPKLAEAAAIRPLPPVITNLAGTESAWVRIEASIVLADEAQADDLLAAKIAEDMVAFLRTIPLADIEGASGFQHLREDLKDRVRVRSDGRARDLVIHTLIIE